MDARALYQALLAGRLDDAARDEFARRLHEDPEFAAALAQEDPEEVLLVTRLLWAESGGCDSSAPRLPPARATAAATAGLQAQGHRRRQSRHITLGIAAAAVVVLGLGAWLGAGARDAASEESGALSVRGQDGDVGVAVDWESDGHPVLSGDVLPAGTQVGAQWTNPDGRYSHLSLGVLDAAGRWHPLAVQTIGAVAPDDEVAPAGPFPLALPTGAIKLCGVFSKGAPAATAPEGVRVCSDVQLGPQ